MFVILAILCAVAHGATADGSLFAYDTVSGLFTANADPIYYGTNTQANGGGPGTITLGVNASTAGAINGIAVGLRAKASGSRSLALGAQSTASGLNSIATGQFSAAAGAFSLAAGYQSSTTTTAVEGIALGYIAAASKAADIAIGPQASAGGGSSIAMGQFAQVDALNGIAIGAGAASNLIANSVSLGTNAQPYSAAYAFGLSLNAVSVTPNSFGITINGVPRIVPVYGALYASTGGTGGIVLSVSSATLQVLMGAPQTVRLPLVSTLSPGQTYTIVNGAATGVVNVVSSGGNLKLALGPKTAAQFVCVSSVGTTDAAWLALANWTVV